MALFSSEFFLLDLSCPNTVHTRTHRHTHIRTQRHIGEHDTEGEKQKKKDNTPPNAALQNDAAWAGGAPSMPNRDSARSTGMHATRSLFFDADSACRTNAATRAAGSSALVEDMATVCGHQ